MQIYVGAALTHAPQKFVVAVKEFKDALERDGFEVAHWLGLTEGTLDDVYERDIEQGVKGSDLIILVLDIPATGLGIELAVALSEKKPILAVAHQDIRVSRLVLAALGRSKQAVFYTYQNSLLEVVEMVRQQWWLSKGARVA